MVKLESKWNKNHKYTSQNRGYQPNVTADAAHAEGKFTTASGFASHAEGESTTASGISSHAEGILTNATGRISHTEGLETTASGDISHAEGEQSTASGKTSHAEGYSTTASGFFSHAEGELSFASGRTSHAEGFGTQASGWFSHAEGFNTVANGTFSHASGFGTSTGGFDGAFIIGSNGTASASNSFFIANGSTAFDPAGCKISLLNNGNGCFDGTVSASSFVTAPGACNYAEMYESLDGQPIEVGYFVTLDGEKIRKANANDHFILGITSPNPGILADTEDQAFGKYLLDEWNRPINEEVTIPKVIPLEENFIIEEHTELRKKINPEWDPENPSRFRLMRPEWVAVGLIGKMLVRDDGTCQVNRFCKPNNAGIATESENGFRVMKRTGRNQILVLVTPLQIVENKSTIEQLSQLIIIKEKGYLSIEEFEIEKQKLLNK
ncbi:peptidase G2 autoproteolytic cleavage domain-containing protein [Neobacillus sp. 179-C4.2 HS]|uniref:Peptidase G2 autoproteolytic cleavage domain-containing protein n=1 Tax=Neobacillus driksii TaxID=3035913 RepID=A0ABV4YSB5_9BACI|nr:peptidase G2 autoproteolytic cleavage domain-containing protein [Neobacillus sp. 179.-C4.2 HS]MDP5194128.1 peptidase G2 autoproteolytic cleavage domain-containing protein [Neobacillus sp. 179.-C4.2 HS]